METKRRIGINASAVSKVKGGASFYIVNLIQALAREDRENRYYIFCTRHGRQHFADLPSSFTVLPIAPQATALRLLWEQTLLPLWICRTYRLHTLFSPNYTSPALHPGVRSVVTIFDLSFFPLAQLYPFSRRLFKPIIKLSCRSADAIIAISEHTKRDIITYVGDYGPKTYVVYCAADERFSGQRSPEEVAAVRKRHAIGERYILFVGFKEPRKNLGRLLQAFSSIVERIPHQLVLAGGDGWWYESTYRCAQALRESGRVIVTGYVPDNDMPALYTGADLFAFTSLYEGFGIAALEAICCGTPVLAANNTALPEVVGNAGVLVDPENADEIADKMLLALTDPVTQNRLRAAAPAACARFNWNTTAQKTMRVLLAQPVTP